MDLNLTGMTHAPIIDDSLSSPDDSLSPRRNYDDFILTQDTIINQDERSARKKSKNSGCYYYSFDEHQPSRHLEKTNLSNGKINCTAENVDSTEDGDDSEEEEKISRPPKSS